MSGVPSLRLSHPTNYGPLEVGCDKRANANAGTPIHEFCESTDFVTRMFLRTRHFPGLAGVAGIRRIHSRAIFGIVAGNHLMPVVGISDVDERCSDSFGRRVPGRIVNAEFAKLF